MVFKCTPSIENLLDLTFCNRNICAFIFFISVIHTQAQQTIMCDTGQIQDSLTHSDIEINKKEKLFEKRYRDYLKNQFKSNSQIDTLPVVIHIIHDAHALGSDENPTDSEIVEKISQTNERFRHINQSDGPNQFSNADTEIVLCLAEIDTLGNYTTGIIRHDDSLTYNTPSAFSAALDTYKWDTNKYLNIFEIEYISDAIGRYYSGQDVVTVRTGTSSWLLAHEIGHYFSLKHTFQDGCINNDCLIDGDAVCDTPPKAFSGIVGSCGNPGNSCTTDEDDTSDNNPYRALGLGGIGDQVDILQNYMDYTEGCGGSFTEGQKNRMKANIVLERETNIAHSIIACNLDYEPLINAAISDITFTNIVCQDIFTPSIEIINYGSSNLTSAILEIYIGANLVYMQNWTGNLATDQSEWIHLANPLTIPEGRHKIYVSLNSPNGSIDEFENDNTMSRYVSFYETGFDLPYTEQLMEFAFPEHWQISNSQMKWFMNGFSGLDTCQSDDRLLGYNGTPSPGSAIIELPPIDVTEYSIVKFSFDLGYIPHSATYPDSLKVEVLDACGSPMTEWEIDGFAMATNNPPAYGNAYVYPTCSDIENKSFDISSIGCTDQISFRITLSGWAKTPIILDNLFVDIEAPCVPNGCTYLTSPELFATQVLPDANLSWTSVPSVDGYFIDIGLSPTGTELLNHLDVGNVNMINPPVLFPCDTTVYVKIIPYIGNVEQSNCEAQSFDTYSFPVCEPTFTPNIIGSGTRFTSASAADFDNDEDIDLVSLEYLSGGGLAWWENDGSQNYTKHVLDINFRGGNYIEAVDMDEDNDIDILGTSRFSNEVAWWENDGLGNFTKHIIDSSIGQGSDIRCGDLDNDGYKDVVAVTSWGSNNMYLYENDGSGNYSKTLIDNTLTGLRGMDMKDMNADGLLDIIAAGEIADEVVWYENNGNLSFTKHSIDNMLDGAFFVDAADINEDGHIDIAATAVVGDQVVWYENDGLQNFTKHIVENTLNGATGIDIVDLDFDGDMDIMASSPSSANLVWYENDGLQNFSKTILSNAYSYVISFLATDIDNNGTRDIIVPFYFASELAIFTNSCSALGATYLINPVEGSQDVHVNSNIEWFDDPNAEGYFLAIGSELYKEDIFLLQDVGQISEYNLPAFLPINSQIFVTILPYNSDDQIIQYYQGSFTTETCVSNISFINTDIADGIYLGDGNILIQGSNILNLGDVFISSDTEVLIQPSFNVELGSLFEVTIQDCGN